MESWTFSDENLDLLNTIIQQCQEQSQNSLQNDLHTLFCNNLNIAENINDTTNLAASVIHISSDEEEINDEPDEISHKQEEQNIEISDDFKIFLENFENEDVLLSEKDFFEIMKSNKINNVFIFLEKHFSSESLHKFCMYLASLKNIENEILKSFCCHLLYPKFMKSSINTSLQIGIQEIFKRYEDFLCENLLENVIDQKTPNLCVLTAICDKLTTDNKQKLLSKLLNSCEKLNEEQIELIQILFVNDTIDNNLKQRLINLLYESADLCAISKTFGKLVLTVFKTLNSKDLSDFQSSLQYIVSQNKSIYKRAVEKIVERINK